MLSSVLRPSPRGTIGTRTMPTSRDRHGGSERDEESREDTTHYSRCDDLQKISRINDANVECGVRVHGDVANVGGSGSESRSQAALPVG